MVLAKGERLAVIDTGLAAPIGLPMPDALAAPLAALGETLSGVRLILHTHGHWDHVQGTPALVEASRAEVWIPAPDFDRLPFPADRLLADGDRVDLGGGLSFDVIATPGHSAGIVCFYEPKRRLLIASDAAQGCGDGGLPLYFHSGRAYRASLQKLMDLDIGTMILGHRFKWSGPESMLLRGAATVRSFLAESLRASTAVENAVHSAVGDCPNRTLPCIVNATVGRLTEDPAYRHEPVSDATLAWFTGTVYSELCDHGIQLVDPEARP